MLSVKKKISHLITTDNIYHVVVMTAMRQLLKKSNTLGRKGAIPSHQHHRQNIR